MTKKPTYGWYTREEITELIDEVLEAIIDDLDVTDISQDDAEEIACELEDLFDITIIDIDAFFDTVDCRDDIVDDVIKLIQEDP